MAKRIPQHDNEPTAVDTPLPFDPRRLYTDREAAEGFRITERTWDRWCARGLITRRARFNGRNRNLGDDLNQVWQSRLEKIARNRAEAAMGAPTNSALAALIEQLAQRVTGLIRDLERYAALIAAEEWQAGYMHGYQEAKHEICHDDE